MNDDEKPTHPVLTRLPTGIIAEIDALVAANRYTSRSDFIREACRLYLNEIEDLRKRPYRTKRQFSDCPESSETDDPKRD